MPKNKKIRFIDSKYNTLFEINDGEKVTLIFADGEKLTRECRYIDEYHFYFGTNCYHICQFAEMNEKNGTKVVPFEEKEEKNEI